ncbi:MAG: stage II sporulation protein M [Firmicutes bacterium]|nr:stage II sporulation protein M [Bacillota bacterium]
MTGLNITEFKKLLKRDWIFLLVIALLFIFSIRVGSHLPRINPSLAKTIEKYSLNFFTEMYDSLKGKPYFDWVIAIWTNNLKAAGTMILIGALFPLLPLASLIFNGLIIGVLEKTTLSKTGISAFQMYLSLLPHGIFELTAIFIAVYTGIRFGLVPYRLLWTFFLTGAYKPTFREFLKEAGYYCSLTFVLLFIAALIESRAILIQ